MARIGCNERRCSCFSVYNYCLEEGVMQRCAAVIVGLFLLLASTAIWAENTKLKFCTGSLEGNYYASGEEIKRQVARQNIDVELIATDGSMDNMQRMAKGECDAGFAQIDAYLHYQALNQDSRLEVERPRHLYEEYLHLVCRRDTGIGSIKQLRKPQESFSLVAGAPGSGTSITWDSITRLNPDYLDVETQNAGHDSALSSVVEGKASCLMLVSGLGTKYLALIDESGEQLRLISVDDKAFQEARHFGRPIYDFRDIPKDTYRNLQAPSGEPVETLVVKAVMLVSSAWAGNHASALDTLIEGVERATPIIRKRVSAQ